jgi:hypothetical protein
MVSLESSMSILIGFSANPRRKTVLHTEASHLPSIYISLIIFRSWRIKSREVMS